jgi:hypothetical protein
MQISDVFDHWQAAEKLRNHDREGHDFSRAIKSLKMYPRFCA